MKFTLSVLATITLFAVKISFAQEQAAIPGVIAAGTRVELVQEGFSWTEGPVGTADGGLYFNDVRTSRMYRLDPHGKISTIREDSGGANGMGITKSGDLYAVEGAAFAERGVAGRRVSRANQTGHPLTVSDSFDGKPYGAPNDMIFDSKGGIYFTDPGPHPFGNPNNRGNVFYLPPKGNAPLRIDDQMGLPNGVTLTMDGKTLLVADGIEAKIWRYNVNSKGGVSNKSIFTDIRQIGDVKASVDSMCIDSEDRIYTGSGSGLEVFDGTGQFLGLISIPRRPANCAFSGPEKKTLYVTAREGLYRIAMISRGPKRAGK